MMTETEREEGGKREAVKGEMEGWIYICNYNILYMSH